MKIQREHVFTPVTITLETKKDFDDLIRFIDYFSQMEEANHNLSKGFLTGLYHPSETLKYGMRLKQQLKNA